MQTTRQTTEESEGPPRVVTCTAAAQLSSNGCTSSLASGVKFLWKPVQKQLCVKSANSGSISQPYDTIQRLINKQHTSTQPSNIDGHWPPNTSITHHVSTSRSALSNQHFRVDLQLNSLLPLGCLTCLISVAAGQGEPHRLRALCWHWCVDRNDGAVWLGMKKHLLDLISNAGEGAERPRVSVHVGCGSV